MKEPTALLLVSVSLHAQLKAIAEARQMLLRDLTDNIIRDWLSLKSWHENRRETDSAPEVKS